MNEFNSHKLFARKAAESVTSNQVAGTAAGNSYAIATDNAHYVLLCFLSPVFDENLLTDAEYLVPFYFKQNCYCVTMWFRKEDVTAYLKGAQYTLDSSRHYYAFFNHNMEQTALDVKGQFKISYSALLTDPYIFCTTDDEGQQHVYRVLQGKAKEMKPEPPDLDYKFGQYYGCVERANGRKEFIFSYALDIA